MNAKVINIDRLGDCNGNCCDGTYLGSVSASGSETGGA
jgi:hypothetical protein